MRFSLLCDAHQDAGLDKVLFRFSDLGLKRYFEERNYGDTLAGVTVVLMCRNPALNLKQRIRHAKKEKKLYMDIMFDLDQFRQLKNLLTQSLEEEWTWILHTTGEDGRLVSRIYKEIGGVSVFRKEDWPGLISFFKPRLIALDEFWSSSKYAFEALK